MNNCGHPALARIPPMSSEFPAKQKSISKIQQMTLSRSTACPGVLLRGRLLLEECHLLDVITTQQNWSELLLTCRQFAKF